jgi:hypothetical protein
VDLGIREHLRKRQQGKLQLDREKMRILPLVCF